MGLIKILVIETGLSDFHKMIVTVVKRSYRKTEPKAINYRDYKSFSNEGFRESLLENLKGNYWETLTKALAVL